MQNRKKTIITSFIAITLLFLASINLDGQVIRLKKSTGDGEIITGGTAHATAPCLKGDESVLNLTLENNTSKNLTITNISVASTPNGLIVGTNFNSTGLYMLNSQTANLDLYLINNWNNLIQNNTFYIEIIITYKFTPKYGNGTTTVITNTYNYEYNICKPDSENHSSSNRIKSSTTPLEVSPNPTKGVYQLKYTLNKSDDVSIRLYNSLGKEVEILLPQQTQEKGEYLLNAELPSSLASGIYFITSKIGDKISSQRLVKI